MQRLVAAALAMLGLSALVFSAPSLAQPAASASPAPAAPAPAPATSPPPAAGTAAPAGSAEAKKGPPPQTGGYSWTDKPRAQPRRQPKRRTRIKFDPNAPLASYPGFRMAADGSSKVWVSVTRPVDVQVRRAGGHVTFVLSGAHVGVRNNTNPLVTTHFNTPLERARLLQDRAGTLLVLDLRETAEPTHKVSKGPYGTMVLEIALPRAQRTYADRVVPSVPPAGRATPAAATPRGSSSPRGPAP